MDEPGLAPNQAKLDHPVAHGGLRPVTLDPSITTLAFVGDSLTDSGNFYALATELMVDPVPSDLAGYAGQYSDGAMHADLLPGLLGLSGGETLNFAWAKARAIGTQPVIDFVEEDQLLPEISLDDPRLQTDINLGAQVDRLLDPGYGIAAADRATTAVHMLIGINDFQDFEVSGWVWEWEGQLRDLMDDIVDAIELQVRRLVDAGIGAVMLATLPDVTFFPAYDDANFVQKWLADGAIDDFNAKLEARMAGLAAEGAPVEVIDLHALTDQIEADRFTFGLKNIETPILDHYGEEYDPDRNVPVGQEDGYGFMDKFHPVAEVQEIFAVFQSEVLTSAFSRHGDSGTTIIGTPGQDLVLAGGGADTVELGAGDDVALGGTGNDLIEGDAGSDLLSGGAGRDTILGGDHEDLIAGGRDDDALYGDRGDDLIVDGLGNDYASGGGGNDTFFWMHAALLWGSSGDRDRFEGKGGQDILYVFLPDEVTFLEAEADLATRGSRGSVFDLRWSGIETVVLLDTSTPDFELPSTGNATLDDRIAEADLWGFV